MSAPTVESFRLPDVGEGLTEAEIVTWRVAVGDPVAVNQVLVEIETAKSLVELPSPFAGEVVELLAAEGDTVPVGTPIIAVRTGPHDEPDDDGDSPKLLVGYGAREPRPPRPRTRPRAKPPVRKLARDLGVDLAAVAPSGADGIVGRDDVLAAAEPRAPELRAPEPVGETRIPIKGVRKHVAAAMVTSAFTAPHVTEFVTVDITRTMRLRETVQRRTEFDGVKVTPLVFVARAYLRALARTPLATARWDEPAQDIVIPAGINLGIAAATPRGLIVPNIKNAHALDLLGLARALDDLTTRARAGTATPESMTGGTTTITNIGVFGIDAGTPILNPGETAILAVGAVRRRPWVVEDRADGTVTGERLEPRDVVQLALSFDHRVLDGQQASQLLADTAELLTEPGLAML
ncbi:dihydrolipoamide acetyltransferase family protein [Spongisporangium articulatum]|uniref:Dihydrolipoamide acetyltransferase component of pyruvate dehydrogenase complex n=1 Tax=Spongisporangium articulatum TaxID=3362603 RepID=A0ABW8AVK6_9ACTN